MERVPFPCYLVQLSAVLSLSAYCMGCHTAAAVGARRRGKCLAAVPSCGSWLHLCWQNFGEVLKESPRNLKLRSPQSLCLSSAKTRRQIFKLIFDHLHRDCLTRTHPWETGAERPWNKSPGQVYSAEVSLSQILVGSLLSTSRSNEPLLSLPRGWEDRR